LDLQPLLPTVELLHAAVEAAVRDAPNAVQVREYVETVVQGQLSLYQRTLAAAPWIGYLARDEETDELVGSCSFIGTPRAGSVEVAYFTFPPYEGGGVATSMARALLSIAANAGNPKLHAFTLPQQNASTRVLQKLGFKHVGEAKDEDAGLVWRWERNSTP
jgi:RimJ/RimL family protein N-acetyltransferase